MKEKRKERRRVHINQKRKLIGSNRRKKNKRERGKWRLLRNTVKQKQHQK